MRATAFEPPPPTPITLIRVPCEPLLPISNFRSSISRIDAMPIWSPPLLATFIPSSPAAARSRCSSRLRFQLRRIHRQTGGRGPRGIVQAPPANPECRPAGRCAPGNSAPLRPCRTCRAAARRRRSGTRRPAASWSMPTRASSRAHEAEQLLGARFQNLVDDACAALRAAARSSGDGTSIKTVVGGQARTARSRIPASTSSASSKLRQRPSATSRVK